MYLHISHTVWSHVCCYNTLLPNVLTEKIEDVVITEINHSLKINLSITMYYGQVLVTSTCMEEGSIHAFKVQWPGFYSIVFLHCSGRRLTYFGTNSQKKQLLGKRIFTIEASKNEPHTNELNCDFSYIYIYGVCHSVHVCLFEAVT